MEIRIHTEYIQLQQLLKLSGLVLSGGEAKEVILSGKALVNGESCTMRGKKLRPGDRVSLNGREVTVVGEVAEGAGE